MIALIETRRSASQLLSYGPLVVFYTRTLSKSLLKLKQMLSLETYLHFITVASLPNLTQFSELLNRSGFVYRYRLTVPLSFLNRRGHRSPANPLDIAKVAVKGRSEGSGALKSDI
jgi:hypothetical protein